MKKPDAMAWGWRYLAMHRQTWVLVIAALATALAAAPLDLSAQPRRPSCTGSDRLSVSDLDMSPGPVANGLAIQRWRVVLNVDGDGECDTVLMLTTPSPSRYKGRRGALEPNTNLTVTEV